MTIRNPQMNELESYCAFRNPIDVEARAIGLIQSVQLGKADLNDDWILVENDQIVAAWSYIAAVKIVILRSLENIPDTSVEKILAYLESSATTNTLILKKSLSRLFDGIARTRGWEVQESSLHFLTSLENRTDLQSDNSIQTFELTELDSEAFQSFFKQLNSEQSLLEIKERFENYENSSVQIFCQEGQYVAAGVLGLMRDTVVMDVIGVLPEQRRHSIGSRLHQHMMWIGQNLGDSYIGMTDAKNEAMLKIFKRNRCIENDEQVNLSFKSFAK
jgi:ribosomal protein S18 acetylase RimI-like enzyme